jgi:hypothetical protein
MPQSNRTLRWRRIARKALRTALIVKGAQRLGHRADKHLEKR